MAVADATMFPVKGQALRVSGVTLSSSTGNVITGGLTTLAATISKDGGAFSSIAGTITEIGTTGYWTLDLTSADMSATSVIVKVTAANANAVYDTLFITPADLTETSTHWMLQTVKRIEQGWLQMLSYWINKVTRGNAANSTITMYKSDGVTTYMTMTTTNDGTTETKNQAS